MRYHVQTEEEYVSQWVKETFGPLAQWCFEPSKIVHLDSVKDGLMPDAGKDVNSQILDYCHFIFSPPVWRHNGF